MTTPIHISDDCLMLASHQVVPNIGYLPIHSYLLRTRAPILVDTGATVDSEPFLEALDTVVCPEDLRFILLTHEDADHAGALAQVLDRAPKARLVTTMTGFGKLSAALQLDPARVELVRPGSRLELDGTSVEVLRAPHYDSPATMMFHLPQRSWLFTSDAFGAFVPELTERAEQLAPPTLGDGMSMFCRANSPWLVGAAEAHTRALAQLASLDPALVLPSHLPPIAAAGFRALLGRAAQLPGEGELLLPELGAHVLGEVAA